jgi:hypothetical protein
MLRGSANNPFALSDFEPDQTPYVFGLATKESYLAMLDVHGWNAELVGPHGVGKTTLLHTLLRIAKQRGSRVVHFRCSGVQPRLPWSWPAQLLGKDLVFLDGAERILTWQLKLLERVSRWLGAGLVSTAHVARRDVLQIPVEASAVQLAALVGGKVCVDELRRILTETRGSAREALVELYETRERDYASSMQSG